MSNTNNNETIPLFGYIKKAFQYLSEHIKNFSARENIITKYSTKYKLGQMSYKDSEYDEYQKAVFANRFGGRKFRSLMNFYKSHIYPIKNKQAFLTPEQLLQLITYPQKYVVLDQAAYQQNISAAVDKVTKLYRAKERNVDEEIRKGVANELRNIRQQHLILDKASYQKRIKEAVDTAVAEALEAQQIKERNITEEIEKGVLEQSRIIRQDLMNQLLPFISDEAPSIYSKDYFRQKDGSRRNYYNHQKRLEKLEERERKTGLKEEHLELKENKLEVQQAHMEVRTERVGLQSDKLDLEKQTLNIQQQKLEVKEERIELQQLQLHNERKLLELQIAKQEIEHKTSMLELANLSLDIQKRTNDIEQMKREMEITQGLHDLETLRREQTLEYGQQLLQLKEQGLENQMQRKEAEFMLLQMDNKRTQIDIEKRIMVLQEGEFKAQAQEQLLEVKNREVNLLIDKLKMHRRENNLQQRNEELKIELKQERMAIQQQEQVMYDKQQDFAWKLQDQRRSLSNVEQENSRLIKELRSKGKYF